jgi:fatty acid CoA ligase FadD9
MNDTKIRKHRKHSILKGVIISRRGYKLDNVNYANYTTPNVIVSYAALGHGMDRGLIWQTISNGGAVVFCPRESQLLDYCHQVNPTTLVGFPQLWNMIYADYLNKKESEHALVKKLGTRLRIIGTGGSVTSPEVLQFLQSQFSNAIVVDSYGLTEIPGICNNNIIRHNVQVKLCDVPHMDYTSQDKPFPRGEILVKSETQTTGYYRQPELSKNLFDNEGFIHTGDIGYIDGDGKLFIIDRKTNFVEIDILGCNIWIPIGELESKLYECGLAKQIFVHGDRIESALIAVVVPTEFTLDIKERISIEFDSIVNRYSLPEYYKPQAIVIETNDWTCDNGLLTANGKTKRKALLDKYRMAIDMEYGSLSLSRNHTQE